MLEDGPHDGRDRALTAADLCLMMVWRTGRMAIVAVAAVCNMSNAAEAPQGC